MLLTIQPNTWLIGEVLALATAVCWAVSALSFEVASRRVGSVPVNLIRLVIAFALLCLYCAIVRGRALPTDATPRQWKWLLASGAVGFFIGDLCGFRALVLLGTRVATLLVMTLAPLAAALTAWLVLGERLTTWNCIGVGVTLAGVVWVISERIKREDDAERLHHASPSGIVLGVLAAAGQGVGVVLTKVAVAGSDGLDPFAATQIRALAGLAAFALLVLAAGHVGRTLQALKRGGAMGYTVLGAASGPFLGVSLLNASVARIPAGVAQTLVSIVPVLLIPFVVVVRKERVTIRAIFGAIIAVAGVAMLVLHGSGGR